MDIDEYIKNRKLAMLTEFGVLESQRTHALHQIQQLQTVVNQRAARMQELNTESEVLGRLGAELNKPDGGDE